MHTAAKIKPQKESIQVLPYHITKSGRYYHFMATSTIAQTSDGVKETKKKSKKNKKLAPTLRNYLESTTLHGFKYLADFKRPKYERAYWMITLLLAYCLVSLVIYDQIEYFFTNPVLISIESNPISVANIPFPAITICPDSQILSNVYNLSSAVQNYSFSSLKDNEAFNYAMLVCHLTDSVNDRKFLKYLKPEFVHQMMNSVNGEDNCEKLIKTLLWSGNLVPNPCKYFQPVITFFGACLSFNMLPAEHIFRLSNVTIASYWSEKYFGGRKQFWSPESGFLEKPDPTNADFYNSTPPWVANEGSIVGAHSIYIGIPKDQFDDSCSSGGRGFFTVVHNAAEAPSKSHPVVYTDAGNLEVITISPTKHVIDKRLLRWPPEDRGCYFESERYLRFFKIYTQRNCELECEANQTERACNCRAFYHPRTQDIPVCGPALTDCVNTLYSHETGFSCDCLPSCSELYYQISSVKFNRKWNEHLLDYPDKISDDHLYLGIYLRYQSRYVDGLRRDLMVSLTDFIANIGGIFGLFLGFSFISVLEILYFVSFRYYTFRSIGE